MIRLGLCCKFIKEKIKFREARYIHLKNLPREERLNKLDELIEHNQDALRETLLYCFENQIYAFRIGSSFLPLYTHPDLDYTLHDLPNHKKILTVFDELKKLAKEKNIRLSTHPDQFVILNSPREEVVDASIEELNYHHMLLDLLGGDVINIHAGGVYGDKNVALKRLRKNIERLSEGLRRKLTFENDDKSYTPQDLLPLCKEMEIAFVYDIHHHRVKPDQYGEVQATEFALKTWDREPLFHISSPKEGWDGPKPNRHHDYIDPNDFPSIWNEIGSFTVDIEAKAKELAIFKLKSDLNF